MSEKFSITKFVPEFLKSNPDKRFTAREIAIWIVETYPDSTEEKRKQSTAKKIPLDTPEAMLQQIVAEIGAQRKGLERNYEVRTTEGRPRKYYFTAKSLEEEAGITNPPPQDSSEISVRNADQRTSTVDFLHTEFSILGLRIDEKRSVNNRGPNGNRWLFPDIVALEDLSASWDRDVVDTVKEVADTKTRLWSFEVKTRINPTNLRESYFQAVSNSSWANFGYLVAAEISGTALDELRILSSLHGIGVLKFDPEVPSDSQILIPATEQDTVDWGTINRLVEQNVDFRRFLKLLRQFYQTGETHKALWSDSGR
jgi:uncharacterized protein